MSSTTCLIDNQNISDVDEGTNSPSLSDREVILDLSIELKDRMNALVSYQEQHPRELLELVNRLCGMFQFSGTNIIKRYLIHICRSDSIHDPYKTICVKSLCYFYDSIPDEIYDILDVVCSSVIPKDTIATPCKVELVFLLLESERHKDKTLQYFSSIVNDISIDVDYRYKTILSIEKTNDTEFLLKVCMNFINCYTNYIRYKILACQCILQHCRKFMTDFDVHTIQTTLLGFGQDVDLDTNVRADATDVLLSLGDEKTKTVAKQLIKTLGRDVYSNGNVMTIWEDGQNVHTQKIEESVLESVEKLVQCDTLEINNYPIDVQYVIKKIKNKLKDEKKKLTETYHKTHGRDDSQIKSLLEPFTSKEDDILISLNRIYNDRVLYTRHQLTLSHVLVKVWSWIKHNDEYESECMKRLEEELVDMSGTCSTGYITRLVNVLSGFSDFSIKISWKDQIISNFKTRLNSRIMDIKDESFQEKVLEEFMISVGEYGKRLNFLKFFRENMLSIREELYKEFKEYISDVEFDLCIRDAIMAYEGVSY